MRSLRRLAVAILVVVVGLAAAAAAFAQDDEKVVFTVGVTNDYDTLNPLVGVEVPDYEVWNIQYATLTDKAADDFHTIPGLAESWEASDDGKTYTYTLREGLTWSDGTPLTADDIAFTVNRGRAEAWLNYASTVGNLTAKVIDDRTVQIHSSVPDPKLPTMDVYILPKHIWDKYDKAAITKYDGQDGVGSGPFTLKEAKRGQFWSFTANPGYWGGKPKVDEVVFRLFTNPDAMIAALESGEVDAAASDVSAESFPKLQNRDDIVAVAGEQGTFTEISVNGGRPEDQRVDGIGNGNPVLADIRVRQAIAHAIDKQTLLDRVSNGLGRVGGAIGSSANPEWTPEIPESKQYTFDLAKANQILDAAGYKDTNGDGIRENDGNNIVLTYYILSDSQTGPGNAEFVTGWLKQIGIGTSLKTVSGSRLTEIIGKGDYDMFQWGWTPFVDPDPMLSYFQCNQLSKDPANPTNYYNDANWCSKRYDASYKAQNVQLDHDKRLEIVHRMLSEFYDSASYNVLTYDPELQAYRTDRFTGWIRQPADVGPVLFTNTSPTYANLAPVASSGGGGGGGLGTAGIIGIVVVGGLAVGIVVLILSRRRSTDERE